MCFLGEGIGYLVDLNNVLLAKGLCATFKLYFCNIIVYIVYIYSMDSDSLVWGMVKKYFFSQHYY